MEVDPILKPSSVSVDVFCLRINGETEKRSNLKTALHLIFNLPTKSNVHKISFSPFLNPNFSIYSSAMATTAEPETTANGSQNPSEYDTQTIAITTTTTTIAEAPEADTAEPDRLTQNPELDSSSSAPQPSTATSTTTVKWPGWPGDCVFRLIVPVLKVGSIIGRKGDLIKKMCDETRARIRVLDAPVGTPDRVVCCLMF